MSGVALSTYRVERSIRAASRPGCSRGSGGKQPLSLSGTGVASANRDPARRGGGPVQPESAGVHGIPEIREARRRRRWGINRLQSLACATPGLSSVARNPRESAGATAAPRQSPVGSSPCGSSSRMRTPGASSRRCRPRSCSSSRASPPCRRRRRRFPHADHRQPGHFRWA